VSRIFVAVWPPEAIASRLAELTADAGEGEHGVRPVPIANLHVTLRFLGEADVIDVVDRLGAVVLQRTTVGLGPTTTRLGSRQVVVPAHGVDGLAATVRAATTGLGEPDRHEFVGHVTVARTRPGAGSSIIGRPVAVSFEVTTVRVVESRLDASGATYTTVATLPAI
jgi:2'-5' RNA ligase